MPAVGFSLEAAQRIAAAVRKVERQPQDMTGERTHAAPGESSCWAYLLSTDLSGNHWSWLKLVPAAKLPNADEPFAPLESDRPLFDLATPTFFSEHTAREANGNRQISGATVVQVIFIGYDTEEQPVYVFNYGSPPPDPTHVPIHDHRSNLHGGFAYACFHPGSGLPGQPWHV